MDLEAKWMAKVRLAGTPIQKKKKSTLHNYSTPGVKLEDEDKKKVMSYAQRLHIIGSDYK
jgi:hypothetical protein